MPWTHDLDNQRSIKPQEMPIAPPEFSVPVEGKEFARPLEVEQKLGNPVAKDTASVARGAEHFRIYCTPCHGAGGQGAGEVVKRGFLAASDLTGATARGRSDGYIYSYVRHGGAFMPAYAFALRPEEAWDVVNYVRSLQAGASP
jgi:mono/diheme cytochrome c family protein